PTPPTPTPFPYTTLFRSRSGSPGRARQRGRRRQLRLALLVAVDRARREPLRVRRLRTVSAPALRHDRGGHRVDPVAPRRDGRGVPEASLLGAAEAREAAERILPPARLRVVPG